MYVVDSSDRERLGINKAELLAMLSEDELADARLLVFANKQVSFFLLAPLRLQPVLAEFERATDYWLLVFSFLAYLFLE